MIVTYKILTGKYDVAAVPTLLQACTYVTRGNYLRLQKSHFRYDDIDVDVELMSGRRP